MSVSPPMSSSAGLDPSRMANINLADILIAAGTLFDKTEESQVGYIRKARQLLQTWAVIKSLLHVSSAEALCQYVPALCRLSDEDGRKTYGEQIWEDLLQFYLDVPGANGDACVYLGASLLGAVEELYRFSPLPPSLESWSSRPPARRASTLGYVSEIEVLNLDGDEQQNAPADLPRSVPFIGSDEEDFDDTEGVIDSYDQHWKSIISILYLTNLQALGVIHSVLETDEKANFEHEIDRFRVWGCSLFTHPLNLDKILQSSHESTERLRTYVIGILGDIALIAVRLLRETAEPDDKISQKTVLQLQACFGRFEEVNSAVLEIPDSFYDDICQEEEEEDIELITILKSQMTGLIDCLFDVMPTISRIRQIYLLALERNPERLKQRNREIVSTPVKASSSETSGANPRTFTQLPLNLFNEASAYQREKGKERRARITAAITGEKSSQKGLVESEQTGTLSPPYEPHDPVLGILAMDLELAEAIKASLASNPPSEKAQSSDDRAILKQISEWENEISRLKSWSKAFEQGLGPSPTAAQMEARMTAFENLVNIGCIFASAIPKNIDEKSPLADKSYAEQKIKSMVASMPNSRSMDLKIDSYGKSTRDALNALSNLNALSQANRAFSDL